MKATLEYSLPDDAHELAFAQSGKEMYLVLCELQRHVRDRLKHGEPSEAARAELEAVRDRLPHELLERLNVP